MMMIKIMILKNYFEDDCHLVAMELKLSPRMRSSSSLLEIVLVTDTEQLYMIGSAWLGGVGHFYQHEIRPS